MPQEAGRPGSHPRRVAIAGLGTVGFAVANALDDRAIDGLTLAAVAVRDVDKARRALAGLQRRPNIIPSVDELEARADIVLECAPSHLLPAIVRPFVEAGKTAVVLSCGALLDNEHLVAIARAHGGQIVVPTSALLGLDAVSAAAEGTIHSVPMITRKPVRGLVGAPYLVERGIAIAAILMVLWARHSDRTLERAWHVAGPQALTALCLASTFGARAFAPTVAILFLAVVGTYAVKDPFWGLATEWLTADTAATGIAQVNAIGNLGAFLGTALLGVIKEATGSYALGLLPLALVTGAGAVMALALGRMRRVTTQF